MEKVILSSTLLLVKSSSNPNHTFAWVGTINGSANNLSNTINVLLFNCGSLLGIVPILQKDLETLAKCEQTPNVKYQIAYIERLLETLADTIYHKQADDALLDVVSANMQKRVLNQDVIYLSGVKDIW